MTNKPPDEGKEPKFWWAFLHNDGDLRRAAKTKKILRERMQYSVFMEELKEGRDGKIIKVRKV